MRGAQSLPPLLMPLPAILQPPFMPRAGVGRWPVCTSLSHARPPSPGAISPGGATPLPQVNNKELNATISHFFIRVSGRERASVLPVPTPSPWRRRREAMEVPGQLGVMLGWYPGGKRGCPGCIGATAGTGGPGARRQERCSWCGHEMSLLPRKSGWLLPPSWCVGELKIYIFKIPQK